MVNSRNSSMTSQGVATRSDISSRQPPPFQPRSAISTPHLPKVKAGPEALHLTLPSFATLVSSPGNLDQRRPSSHCSDISLADSATDNAAMADGRASDRNEARAMRVLEIMNDFRTIQHHTSSLIGRSNASAPDQASYYLDGYVVLRQCSAESQAILATHYNPGNIGLQTGGVPETEVQKATLQRIILDAATRRLQAHKIYLRASAAMRWVTMRAQVLKGDKPGSRHAQGLRRIDQHLREELSQITDDHVMSDLRAADRRKGYWVDEDPSLDRMLSWIRNQR